MNFPYDAENYEPPAPVALISLHTLEGTGSCEDVPFLIDSGADVTLLPRWAVEQLGIEQDTGESFELMGFDGSVTNSEAVRLALRWQGKTFRGQFLIINQAQGILGRNILNNITLTLDGPRQSWQIE